MSVSIIMTQKPVIIYLNCFDLKQSKSINCIYVQQLQVSKYLQCDNDVILQMNILQIHHKLPVQISY